MPRFEDIQFRRGTAAEWFAVNPVLDDGEPGFETDTGKLKIGDGVSTWNGLSYFAGSGGVGTPGADGAMGPAGPAVPGPPGDDGDGDSMWYPPPGALLGAANFWNAEQRYAGGFTVWPATDVIPVIRLFTSGNFSALGGGYIGQSNPNSGDTGTLGVYGAHTTTTPLVVASGGTAAGDLTSWKINSDLVLALDKFGKLQWADGVGGARDTNLYRAAAGFLQTDGGLIIVESTAGDVALTVTQLDDDFATHIADFNGAFGTTSFVDGFAGMNANGFFLTATSGYFSNLGASSWSHWDAGSPNNLLQAADPTHIPLQVAGAALQSANLQNWTGDAAAIVAQMNYMGQLRTRGLHSEGGVLVGSGYGFSGLGLIHIGYDHNNNGSVRLAIQAGPTQTADLTDWVDDNEVVLSRVDAKGNFYGPGGKKVLTEGSLGSIPFLIPEDTDYDYPWPTGGGAAAAAAAAPSAAYATSIGDGASTSFNVDHALGTLDVQVAIYRNSTGAEIEADITRSTVNRVVIGFVTTPSSNEYRVVVR